MAQTRRGYLSVCPMMSNGGAPLPAGNSTSASAPSANPGSVGPRPVTSPASDSNSGTGRTDISESATPSDQPYASSPTVPATPPSPTPTPARTPDRTPVPTPAPPMIQDSNGTDENEDGKLNSPSPTPAPLPGPAPNGSTGDHQEVEEEEEVSDFNTVMGEDATDEKGGHGWDGF